jgi:hypothetical protein
LFDYADISVGFNTDVGHYILYQISPSVPPLGPLVDTVRVPAAFDPTVTEFTVVPEIVPPVMATALAFCAANVPKLPVAAVTNAVVAICVVLVPASAVGAVGVPVRAALVNIVALLSLVTLPKPTLLEFRVNHVGFEYDPVVSTTLVTLVPDSAVIQPGSEYSPVVNTALVTLVPAKLVIHEGLSYKLNVLTSPEPGPAGPASSTKFKV